MVQTMPMHTDSSLHTIIKDETDRLLRFTSEPTIGTPTTCNSEWSAESVQVNTRQNKPK